MKNLEYFKDKIFDLLNEENTMDIRDIETNDQENTFQIFFEDGSAFQIECHQISQKEQHTKNEIHITEEEKKNCQKVAEVFAEIYEYCDIVVVDIGKYGFAILQYIRIQDGFEQTAIYTDSKHLFHDLWREWLNIQLMDLSRGTPLQDMDLEDIFKCISKDKQYELLNKQLYFAEKTGIENIIQKSKRCLKFKTIL